MGEAAKKIAIGGIEIGGANVLANISGEIKKRSSINKVEIEINLNGFAITICAVNHNGTFLYSNNKNNTIYLKYK